MQCTAFMSLLFMWGFSLLKESSFQVPHVTVECIASRILCESLASYSTHIITITACGIYGFFQLNITMTVYVVFFKLEHQSMNIDRY